MEEPLISKIIINKTKRHRETFLTRMAQVRISCLLRCMETKATNYTKRLKLLE